MILTFYDTCEKTLNSGVAGTTHEPLSARSSGYHLAHQLEDGILAPPDGQVTEP